MTRGDQIYVMRPLMSVEGVYEHHGIDCGDGTVIHYHKGDDAVITRTTMEAFARGNPVYVKDQPLAFIPDVVIERAEGRLGERQYNLLTNNCEHFANWCKTGRNESQQLVNYGLDLSQIRSLDSRRMIEEAAQGGDPIAAMQLLTHAQNNVSVAQTTLQDQYNRAQQDMMTWERVAKLALKKNREDLARAALERKVQAKKQAETAKNQMAELIGIQTTLDRNSQQIKQRISVTS
ncbi:lecithin retinol acyltransferase family protein [Leptolyngbya ohadii]|uniref:lecithin retinol acyltransferase family protein n=1 Tax=Leptolyngbya ohadii TaxID=1962290 RepID=UPI000B5A1A08|nr:lecithin retinol acyltransferase family protein [Leptolyngbya ohadii]